MLPGPTILSTGGIRLGAIGQRCHGLRTTDGKDPIDAGDAGGGQHHLVDLATRGRHHHDQFAAPRRPWPGWHSSAPTTDRPPCRRAHRARRDPAASPADPAMCRRPRGIAPSLMLCRSRIGPHALRPPPAPCAARPGWRPGLPQAARGDLQRRGLRGASGRNVRCSPVTPHRHAHAPSMTPSRSAARSSSGDGVPGQQIIQIGAAKSQSAVLSRRMSAIVWRLSIDVRITALSALVPLVCL